MPSFVIEVRDASGRLSKEKVKADTPVQAENMLRSKYPTVGKAKKAGVLDADINLEIPFIEEFLVNVTVKDKAVFSRQFSAMVNAGVAIVRCLGVLSDQCDNPKLKKSLQGISAEVQQGVNLSDSMRKFPKVFDDLYVAMIEAGETGGVLDEVLDRLAKLLEDVARLQGQIRSAMAYPTAVGIFAIVAFFGMTIFLIPVFAGIFDSLGVTLPLLTLALVNLSELLRTAWSVVILGVIVGIVFAFRAYYKTPVGRLQVDGLMLKLPIFGDLNEKSAVARFTRVFGTLTRSGVPILTSLEIVENTVGNAVIARSVCNSREEVQQGGLLSLALQREQVFPPLALQMISIGEETGELDAMMMKVADFYESEVEEAVKALTSLIEPIMMVGVAVIVGTILMAMYLPLLTVFNELG